MPWNLPPDAMLDRKTAAKYLGVSPGTLAVWDCIKRFPNLKHHKLGKSVKYRRSDLDEFLKQSLVSNK